MSDASEVSPTLFCASAAARPTARAQPMTEFYPLHHPNRVVGCLERWCLLTLAVKDRKREKQVYTVPPFTKLGFEIEGN